MARPSRPSPISPTRLQLLLRRAFMGDTTQGSELEGSPHRIPCRLGHFAPRHLIRSGRRRDATSAPESDTTRRCVLPSGLYRRLRHGRLERRPSDLLTPVAGRAARGLPAPERRTTTGRESPPAPKATTPSPRVVRDGPSEATARDATLYSCLKLNNRLRGALSAESVAPATDPPNLIWLIPAKEAGRT